jgi:hypothetical protein
MTGTSAARKRIRALDACLWRLEEASEHGAVTVSRDLLAAFPLQVPGLSEGVPVRAAIDLLFREQARWLPESHDGGPVRLVPTLVQPRASQPLSRDEARTLTERIRSALGSSSLLIQEAHQRRAWSALGYRSWDDYVRRALGLSRSRSYELLVHASVITSLSEAANSAEPIRLSPYAAFQIKPNLETTVEQVRASVRPGMSQAQLQDVVSKVVGAMRPARHRRQTPAAQPKASFNGRSAVRTGRSSLDQISDLILELPPTSQLTPMMSNLTGPQVARLKLAALKLTQIAAQV